jgi:hypothetical protein
MQTYGSPEHATECLLAWKYAPHQKMSNTEFREDLAVSSAKDQHVKRNYKKTFHRKAVSNYSFINN